MQQDKNKNIYEEVGNIRVTFIDKDTRSPDKDWSGKDTLRFQAYKGADTNALHLGAEIPLDSNETIIELIEALCRLYRHRQII
ncbi:MAG: hypothetical protein JNM67_08280 [Bacteroidetes bacterium]|nr:hypothetical protein [Bacteroidota bacterium]